MTTISNGAIGSFNDVHVSGKGALGVASAMLPLTVDLLDPDSMIAFFSAQMSDVRQKLGAAMADQQTRNDHIKSLTALEGDLVRFKEKGVKPGDPGWETFKADVEQARALMGGSLEGTKLGELMDKAKPAETATFGAMDAKGVADYVNAHPGAVVTTSDDKFVVTVNHGLDPNEVDSLVQQVKGYRDSLQNDNAMNMIRVQQLVESSSQIMNLCSNIMKKMSDAAMSPINNMR